MINPRTRPNSVGARPSTPSVSYSSPSARSSKAGSSRHAPEVAKKFGRGVATVTLFRGWPAVRSVSSKCIANPTDFCFVKTRTSSTHHDDMLPSLGSALKRRHCESTGKEDRRSANTSSQAFGIDADIHGRGVWGSDYPLRSRPAFRKRSAKYAALMHHRCEQVYVLRTTLLWHPELELITGIYCVPVHSSWHVMLLLDDCSAYLRDHRHNLGPRRVIRH